MAIERVKRRSIKRTEAQVGGQFSQVLWSYHPGGIAGLIEFCHAGFHSLRFRQIHRPMN